MVALTNSSVAADRPFGHQKHGDKGIDKAGPRTTLFHGNTVMRVASVIAVLVLGAGAAYAQSKEQATSHFGTVPAPRPETRAATTNVVYRSVRNPNVAYSGALVQAIKSRRPLQLLNPFAPLSYGSALGNTSQEPATGRADGLRIFTVAF